MRVFLALTCILAVCGSALAADTAPSKASAAAAAPKSYQTASAAPAPSAQNPAPAAQTKAVAEAPAPAQAPAPTAETPAPGPAPAPAAEPAPAPKPAEVAKPAAPACQPISWYGLAMFRLRDEMVSNFSADTTRRSANFSNQIAYKLGVKAKPNDQTMLQLEIGNDWYATEEVEGLPGNYWTKRNPMTPWFDLACGQWDPGFMHIQAGIIPVRGTPLMDLLGVSIFFARDYKKAAHIPWGVVTNFSQTGLRLGAPILKGDVSFGVDVMSAILEMRHVGVRTDKFNLNAPANEFELEAPLSMAGLTLTPQAFITPNRSYNMSTNKSDIEFGAGFDVVYKLNPNISLRGGYGYARNSNRNTYKNADGTPNVFYDTYGDPFNITGVTDTINRVTDRTEFDRWGNNINVGTSALLGPGKFDFDFNLSNEQDAYNKNVDDWYPFFDIKYGWMLSKNFILMPRVRLFFTEPKAPVAGIKYNNMLTTRPELIFTSTF